MPRDCMAYLKYKDGHSVIAYYTLLLNAPFGYNEMEKWIMEDEDVTEVKVFPPSPIMRKQAKALKRSKERSGE